MSHESYCIRKKGYTYPYLRIDKQKLNRILYEPSAFERVSLGGGGGGLLQRDFQVSYFVLIKMKHTP